MGNLNVARTALALTTQPLLDLGMGPSDFSVVSAAPVKARRGTRPSFWGQVRDAFLMAVGRDREDEDYECAHG